MRGAVTPLHSTPSWRGAQLKKHGDDFILNLWMRISTWSSYKNVTFFKSCSSK